jgi:hypothetical protein
VSSLCTLPPFIQALTPESPDAARVFQEWYETSWASGRMGRMGSHVLTGFIDYARMTVENVLTGMIDDGLIDLVLDLDDFRFGHAHIQNRADGQGGAGGGGGDVGMWPQRASAAPQASGVPLFAHVYRGIIRVYNTGRALKVRGAGLGSGSFLRRFLQASILPALNLLVYAAFSYYCMRP